MKNDAQELLKGRQLGTCVLSNKLEQINLEEASKAEEGDKDSSLSFASSQLHPGYFSQ